MVTSTNWHSNVRFLYTGLSVKITWMRMANLKLRGQNFGAEPQRISTRSIYKKLSSTRSTPNLRNITKEVHDLRNTSRILFCSIVLLLCSKLCVPLFIQLNRLLLDRSICVHQWCVRKLWLHPKWLLATDVAPDQHFSLSFLFGCFLLGRSDPVGSIYIYREIEAHRERRGRTVRLTVPHLYRSELKISLQFVQQTWSMELLWKMRWSWTLADF